LTKEKEKIKSQGTALNLDTMIQSASEMNGFKVIVQKINDADQKTLLNIIDQLKAKLTSAVVVLGSSSTDKVNLIAMVTKDLTAKVHAGKLIQQTAALVGGGGGGRPDLAQAGGKEPAKLDTALQQVPTIINKMVGG
jgi:alanyl-tRNA synthetase